MRTSDKKTTNDSTKDKRRKVKLPKFSKLNKRLIMEFDNFLEYAPPKRLSRSLRNMFLLYLSSVKDGLPTEFEETIGDLYFLLEFLDNSAEELEALGIGEES